MGSFNYNFPKNMSSKSETEMVNKVEEEIHRQQQEAAKSVVKQNAVLLKDGAVKKAQQMGSFIKESPNPVKVVVLMCGLVLMVSSIIMCFNVLNVVLSPFAYVLLSFNMLFSILIVVVEGPSTWNWLGIRPFLFRHFGFMRFPVGRCFFYLYVGAVVFCQGSSWVFYGLGAIMLVCAVLQLCTLAVEKCQKKKEPLALTAKEQVADQV